MSAISGYLKSVEGALRAGNSTEHTHRPALKALAESFRKAVVATNEPRRIACGSPDFIVTEREIPVGYIEAKDVGVKLDEVEGSEQLSRYKSSLHNLILTDYLEFRLYRNGKLIQKAVLASRQKSGSLKISPTAEQSITAVFESFFNSEVPIIGNPRDLAERMARMARLIHDLIREAFTNESVTGDLHSQYEAFKRVLIADLTIEQFSDMYAQTIAYGLFAARCNHSRGEFSRHQAGHDLPKTNPFLRRLFNSIAGADLDDRITWAVDDLASLLAKADVGAILDDFGKATRREDPVVHFYETFLAAYDPKLRELRGVYYTPEPVVNYIVNSVDSLLVREFKLTDGLADSSRVNSTQRPKTGSSAKPQGKETEVHRVQILDAACGTGTFLHAIVSNIREKFRGDTGLWPSYVAEHLLPRVYGFELLMAPYAVAHMKLGIQLKESGYDFGTDERLRVYLTNTLEQAHEMTGLPLFSQWLAEEASSAGEVKQDAPIMVVVGNPPYSGHSANKGKWISDLLNEYKKSPELKKPAQAKWLSDDYVKFIRFAQWRITQTGYGILAFITNHSYLDNPTFLDMRASLMETFDDLYVLDLHGNTKKKERAPDGSKDENVFDIQQGVAIGLFVKRTGRSIRRRVLKADLWGPRSSKYSWLSRNDVESTKWQDVTPARTPWLFVKQDAALQAEYESTWSVVDIFNQNGTPAPGIVTTHDEFAISWSRAEAIQKVERLLATKDEQEAREIFTLCSQSQWNYERAKVELSKNNWRGLVTQVQYRPFDVRWTIWDSNVAVHRRERVNGHMIHDNIAILIGPAGDVIGQDGWNICFASKFPTDYNLFRRGGNFLFPLWIYKKDDNSLFSTSDNGRVANFSRKFLEEFSNLLDGIRLSNEDVFAYIYSVLFSNKYRVRYAEFLKRDYPRIPLTENRDTFRKLAKLGHALLNQHLNLESLSSRTKFPTSGSNIVEFIKYTDSQSTTKVGRVYINKTQYFENVDRRVYEYKIGGHDVAQKWLKDRRGRTLSFDELKLYGRIISSLHSTLEIQQKIDESIFR